MMPCTRKHHQVIRNFRSVLLNSVATPGELTQSLHQTLSWIIILAQLASNFVRTVEGAACSGHSLIVVLSQAMLLLK
jgi:hypothetical protein